MWDVYVLGLTALLCTEGVSVGHHLDAAFSTVSFVGGALLTWAGCGALVVLMFVNRYHDARQAASQVAIDPAADLTTTQVSNVFDYYKGGLCLLLAAMLAVLLFASSFNPSEINGINWPSLIGAALITWWFGGLLAICAWPLNRPARPITAS
jgi:hypothetical protein